MKHTLLFFLLLSGSIFAFGQFRIQSVIVDGRNLEVLPYATVRVENSSYGVVADINGKFSLEYKEPEVLLLVSYTGYQQALVAAPLPDTIKLFPANNMAEVVISPPYDKIKRILSLAIRNKNLHNPERYEQYGCYVYYKMIADMVQGPKYKEGDSTNKDLEMFLKDQHVLFGETYSRRSYRKSDKLQETILASRLSGFDRTYFSNLVTAFLPFHAYDDDIKLNGISYQHPVAAGWQGRYEYNLDGELVNEQGDTTFMFSFYPKKGVHFNSLKGLVYISSDGYAISHLTVNSIDSGQERYLKMEQNYKKVEGKWFPSELNFDFIFRKYPSDKIGLRFTGHSLVDSVSYSNDKLEPYSAAYPVKLHDSVDLRTEEDWSRIRKETLSDKEERTYVFMDSLSDEIGLNKIMEGVTYASITGRVPVSVIDIDITKLIAFNAYEKYRLGLGLYTNDKLTKYMSVGGWFGYGTADKEWKYGGSLNIYPFGKKDYRLEFSYQNTYRNTGNVDIHRELDRNYYRNLLLDKVDRIEQYAVKASGRVGYLDATATYSNYSLTPQYSYHMGYIPDLQGLKFDVQEIGLNFRYAYGEKRAPIMGYYFPVSTKYPILYADISTGKVSRLGYIADYIKILSAITYKVRVNRWGTDLFRVDGGYMHIADNKALPRSFLLAANGFRAKKNYIYVYGGFVTMYPYAYFNDKYASLIYRHDFERMLYKTKYSSPYISIAYNVVFGSLNTANAAANGDVSIPARGYHENGLMLNRLLRVNYLNLAYLDLNLGAFYHWNGLFDWKKNGTIVVGLGLGL